MTDIVIASAARTPVGSFNGAFANMPAHDLGAVAIKAALERAKLGGEEVDEVILGQVLTAGQGQNPARQAAMKAGIPEDKTAWSLNQVCGSGLRAVALGMLHVASGDADVIVAGGQESMSLSPHAAHMRGGTKMGDVKFVDTMIKDGLWDAFHGYHMGTTAENVAQKWQISREDQDRFAVASQNKAEAAQTSGRFKDEIAPVTMQSRKGDIVVDQDEYIRPGTTLDAVAKLKPAFSKDGTVTAGNASGLNDGAAAFVIMSATEAQRRGNSTYLVGTVIPMLEVALDGALLKFLLDATGRHPWRPAHIHMIVRAPGYQTLVTHILDRASEYLDSDTVFAVKKSLVADFEEVSDPALAQKWDIDKVPFRHADFDIIMQPGS